MILGKASTVSFFINRSNFKRPRWFQSKNMSFVVMYLNAKRGANDRGRDGGSFHTIRLELVFDATASGVLVGRVLCGRFCDRNIVANPEFCVFIGVPDRGML